MSQANLREGNGIPLQYSCLENPMDGGAWWAAVHGVAKSRTQVSDFTLTFHFHPLEKAMATHSSVLAWRILGTGEPGGLPSVGSHRVRHDWSNLVAGKPINITQDSIPWIVLGNCWERAGREQPEFPAPEPEATILWKMLLGVDQVFVLRGFAFPI